MKNRHKKWNFLSGHQHIPYIFCYGIFVNTILKLWRLIIFLIIWIKRLIFNFICVFVNNTFSIKFTGGDKIIRLFECFQILATLNQQTVFKSMDSKKTSILQAQSVLLEVSRGNFLGSLYYLFVSNLFRLNKSK